MSMYMYMYMYVIRRLHMLLHWIFWAYVVSDYVFWIGYITQPYGFDYLSEKGMIR